ncbi:DUF63 family protein [Salinigranum salinum]|uniref:DUF63 family protein n=1 Tax=Salinigranum salinum TaxID=1364937 RepID=UPI00126075E9|nr:DUF63 family protein [Salinigranum salinum]
MLLLPEGFALPPAPYLVALLLGVAVVGIGARRRDLAVDERHILAFVPWMLAGASTHALYVVDALPSMLRPLGGTPAVYATVAVVAGLVWLAADATFADDTGKRTARALGVAGLVAFLPACGAGVAVGLSRGTFAPVWPAIALVVSLAVGAATWVVLRRTVPRVEAAGVVGALAVVAHALDGVSTAVGVDVLGFGERTPLSRVIIETAAGLPTAEVIGAGWLFVVVKLAVASVVVVLLADLVEEDPREGALLLGFVAAVGLGPGAHNLLLFAIAG